MSGGCERERLFVLFQIKLRVALHLGDSWCVHIEGNIYTPYLCDYSWALIFLVTINRYTSERICMYHWGTKVSFELLILPNPNLLTWEILWNWLVSYFFYFINEFGPQCTKKLSMVQICRMEMKLLFITASYAPDFRVKPQTRRWFDGRKYSWWYFSGKVENLQVVEVVERWIFWWYEWTSIERVFEKIDLQNRHSIHTSP